MADFEIAYGETELHEGGYVNDPDDRGGETHRGVARRFHPDWAGWAVIDKLKRENPDDFVRKINDDRQLAELARLFYQENFWNPVRGDEIPDQKIANKLFDTAVNQGVSTSVRFLQEGLNMLNRNQQNYADIPVDGRMGTKSLDRLQAFLQLENRQPDYLLKIMNIMQASRYLEIMRNDATQEKFARGWLNRVNLC
jgi:lysozyme family protein